MNKIVYTIKIQGDNFVSAETLGIMSRIGKINFEEIELAEKYLQAVNDNVLDTNENFQNLGKRLFDSIFTEPIKGHFHEHAWRKLLQNNDEIDCIGIRLIFFESSNPKLIAMPWEFLYYPDGDCFFSTHPKITFSLSIDTIYQIKQERLINNILKILFIHIHPADLEGIGVIPIKNILNELLLTKNIELIELTDPTIKEIKSNIEAFKPDIFHFVGHGKVIDNNGVLALLDSNGNSLWYDSQSFSGFFQTWEPLLCILQSCNSSSVSEYLKFASSAYWMLKQNIHSVIAMRYPFKQKTGWTFFVNFYKMISEGIPIDFAVQKCRNIISTDEPSNKSHTSRDFAIPVLWSNINMLNVFNNDGIEKKQGESYSKNFDLCKLKYLSNIGYKLENITEELYNTYLNYFKYIRETFGYIKLSQITTNLENELPLENIYISLPINLSLSIEIKERKVFKWSLLAVENSSETILIDSNQNFRNIHNYDNSFINSLVGDVQAVIDGIVEDNEYNKNRPLIYSPIWQNQKIKNFYNLEAIDAISIFDHIVIIGGPGSGKSTFAKHLVLSMIMPQLDPKSSINYINSLKKWPHGYFIPIYIELRIFALSSYFPDITNDITYLNLLEFVKNVLLKNDEILFKIIIENLQKGNILFVLDGIDEIPIPLNIPNSEQLRRRQLQTLIRSLCIQFPKCKMVVTSRPYAYSDWVFNDFQTIFLSSLNDNQKHKLAKNIFQNAYPILDSEVLKKNVSMFLDSITEISSDLTNHPLFFTLLSLLYYGGEANGRKGLPTKRGTLLHKNIKLLLGVWTQKRRQGISINELLGCSEEELYERIERIAYRVHCKSDNNSDNLAIDLDIILVELFSLGKHTNPHEVLTFITQVAGILISPSVGVYKFAHRMFQEFMTASYLSKQSQLSITKTITEHPMYWKEVISLLGDIYYETGRYHDIWGLIDALICYNRKSQLDAKQVYFIYLASDLYYSQSLFSLEQTSYQSNISVRLKEHIKKILQTIDCVPPNLKVFCASVLAIIGDDRLGVGLNNNLIPEIFWCSIPTCKVQIGTTEIQMESIKKHSWSLGWQFTREIPAFEIDVKEFLISRFLVTQIQFNAFIIADDGYYNDIWWYSESLLWRNQATPPSKMVSIAESNLPIVGVRWFEAVAFCNWLSFKTGKKIRLPNEIEWETAARGTDGRVFPWGNDFNSNFCNVAATKIGKASPVGCFIFNNPPWGDNTPLDMIGNVWEWCSTICEIQDGVKFEYPYNAQDGRENIIASENHLRVVRGGYYLNKEFFVRTTYRGRDKPNVKLPYEGFRVVCEI
jgi:formylglycine-generating enzyme required for sulfatase activity